MMLARCADPLEYFLLILLFYGVPAAGAVLAAVLLAWGMGRRDRH